MDEQLAAIYGTNQNTESEDQEKLAAAELLVKLAEEEGVDLNQFSDEDIANMVQELYAEQAPESEKTAEAEAQEKVAEADFLGRVMAHAYTQELGEIEKQAADAEPGKIRKALSGAASRAGEWTGVSQIREGLGKRKALKGAAEEGGKALGKSGKELASHIKNVLKAHAHAPSQQALKGGLKRLGLRVGAPAAGLAALGAGVHHVMKKKSSADLDKIAEDRAIQMLMEQGWIDENGNALVQPGQEKQAGMSPEEYVETKALQMLEEAGYPVTWNQ